MDGDENQKDNWKANQIDKAPIILLQADTRRVSS